MKHINEQVIPLNWIVLYFNQNEEKQQILNSLAAFREQLLNIARRIFINLHFK